MRSPSQRRIMVPAVINVIAGSTVQRKSFVSIIGAPPEPVPIRVLRRRIIP